MSPPGKIITVPENIMGILTRLRRLLSIYEGVRRNELSLIYLLSKEIEKMSADGKGNFFIETLISEHNYPRNFEEEEVDETFDVEPFTLSRKG
jgi:hypothetical protein